MKTTTIEKRIGSAIADSEFSSIGFDRYMELALYDPEDGYYGAGNARIGKAGDFFTSVSVGACFGMLLGHQCRELGERLRSLPDGEPEGRDFFFVEQGAANGQLMADVLSGAGPAKRSDRVLLVEPLGHLKDAQLQTLGSLGVSRSLLHASEWKEVQEDVNGIFFCNELLDAMPCKLVRFVGGKWLERRVAANMNWNKSRLGNAVGAVEPMSSTDNGRAENNEGRPVGTRTESPMLPFAWSDEPIRSDALRARVELLGDNFPDGYTTEVNLNYGSWIRSVGQRFQQGILLVFDYGFSRDDLYLADRTEGTLQTYVGHKSGADPLAHAGRCDITSHVDFTELAERAMEEGFDVLGFLDQNHFLMGVGEPWLMELERSGVGKEVSVDSVTSESVSSESVSSESVTSESSSLLRQFQTLTHPGIMGRDFKVLVLGKLVPDRIAKTLSCLRYARPPMPQLGIA